MTHTSVKTTHVPNRVRSAIAPEIRATVMIANVTEKSEDSRSSVPIRPCRPKCANGSAVRPPSTGSPASMEPPHSTHTTPTTPSAAKLIIIMFSTPLARVMPP